MNGSEILLGEATEKTLFEALWSGDSASLSDIISQYLFETISYYYYREDYYHVFLAGLLSGAGYMVKSNREPGDGRADIMVLDKSNRRAAVFGMKRSKDRNTMEMDAETALNHIAEMKYGKDLKGYKSIRLYGAAFNRKSVLVRNLS